MTAPADRAAGGSAAPRRWPISAPRRAASASTPRCACCCMRAAPMIPPKPCGSARRPASPIPAADVTAVDDAPGRLPQVTTTVIGLTGPSGVLPRVYTEAVRHVAAQPHPGDARFPRHAGAPAGRRCSPSAGAEVPPARAADDAPGWRVAGPVTRSRGVLLALTGYGTPHLTDGCRRRRCRCCITPACSLCGPARPSGWPPCSPTGWAAPVEVVQFAGAWLGLPPDQRTRLPRRARDGRFNRLGVDAAVGIRAWDVQARIVLRFGPLDRAAFEALLPDGPACGAWFRWCRPSWGCETGFAINPVLRGRPGAAAAPGGRADPARAARLEHLAAGAGARAARRCHRGGIRGRAGECRRVDRLRAAAHVTDVAYLPDYQPEQSPHHLAAACLLERRAAAVARDRPNRFAYLEIGCGLGFGALVLAASNPAWQVTAASTSIRPISPAAAPSPPRPGSSNARFIEADLATLAEDAGPGAGARGGLRQPARGVELGRADVTGAASCDCCAPRCAPAASVHVSYNALPRLAGRPRHAAAGARGRTPARQRAATGRRWRGCGVVQALLAAEAGTGRAPRSPAACWTAGNRPPSASRPRVHERRLVAVLPCRRRRRDWPRRKLDWVGSAALAENFAELMLDRRAARASHDRFDDPLMRELVKDMCLGPRRCARTCSCAAPPA